MGQQNDYNQHAKKDWPSLSSILPGGIAPTLDGSERLASCLCHCTTM